VYNSTQQAILAQLGIFFLILRGPGALQIVVVIVSVIARRIVGIVVIVFIIVIVWVHGVVCRTSVGHAQSTCGQSQT
jgi:hypothetical protein